MGVHSSGAIFPPFFMSLSLFLFFFSFLRFQSGIFSFIQTVCSHFSQPELLSSRGPIGSRRGQISKREASARGSWSPVSLSSDHLSSFSLRRWTSSLLISIRVVTTAVATINSAAQTSRRFQCQANGELSKPINNSEPGSVAVINHGRLCRFPFLPLPVSLSFCLSVCLSVSVWVPLTWDRINWSVADARQATSTQNFVIKKSINPAKLPSMLPSMEPCLSSHSQIGIFKKIIKKFH